MEKWNVEHQQIISQQITAGTLPHAILICGPHGAGKLNLAKWLINLFNCQTPIINETVHKACNQCKTCLLSLSGTNPDTAAIEDVERTISVDDVRKLTAFLETKPQISNGKSILISEAEKLTVSAANALLKTLEEPSDNSLLILTSVDSQSVLPTILSRCQVITLRPFVGDALSKVVAKGEADPYLNISHLAELNDAELNAQYHQFNHQVIELLNNKVVSSDLEALILHHDYGLSWLERTLINLTRKQKNWQVSESIGEIAVNCSQNVQWELYQLVIQARKTLKSLVQANPLFVKEQLLADIQACITKPEATN